MSSVWERACPWGLQAAILPPFVFTDDSIIPVIVRLDRPHFQVDEKTRSSSSMTTIKGLLKRLNFTKIPDTYLVSVQMPRKDYLKHFAHDEHGRYVGAEPQRTWTEDQLELEFGKFMNASPRVWVPYKQRNGVCMIQNNSKVVDS